MREMLDLNETGCLIAMNVIRSHFLFGTPQNTASLIGIACGKKWEAQKPESPGV